MSDIIKIVPNCISVFRIILIPIFFYFISNNHNIVAVTVVLLAALSDFFDGYVARKLNAQSKTGELLDPIADKLFLNTVLWGLCFFTPPTLLKYTLAILLTLRDLILLFAGFVVVTKKLSVNMKPIYLSKICTTFVFIYAICSIIFINENILLNILKYIVMLLIISTCFLYIKRGLKSYFQKSPL